MHTDSVYDRMYFLPIIFSNLSQKIKLLSPWSVRYIHIFELQIIQGDIFNNHIFNVCREA